MAISAVSNNSGSSINPPGVSAGSFRTEETSKVKEMRREEEEKAEKLKQVESEKAAKEARKTAEEENRAKKEERIAEEDKKGAKAAEEAEKEERKRRIIERRKAEEAKEVTNKEQVKSVATENKTDKSTFEAEAEEEENPEDDNNKDSVTLSTTTASRLANLATRFENTNNKISALDKDWVTDEDFAYQQLQTTKYIIQQQSPAAIFSQANLNPGRVVSFFQ